MSDNNVRRYCVKSFAFDSQMFHTQASIMSLVIEEIQRIPLVADRDSVIRVSGTRMTLDTLVEAFQEGATAEEIAQQYPCLSP